MNILVKITNIKICYSPIPGTSTNASTIYPKMEKTNVQKS